MRTNHPSSGQDYTQLVGNLRTAERKSMVLVTGEEDTLDNYRLYLGTGKDDASWTTPRHRHFFEQIRYVLEGDYEIAKGTIMPPGWVTYFPEAAYYGPQVKHPNLAMLELQFGGPNRNGYYSLRQRKQAHAELIARGGTLKDGLYVTVDEDGKQRSVDSGQATWEVYKGASGLEYPPPQYGSFIMINPDAFPWQKDPEHGGVAKKTVGTFTQNDVRVGFVALENGASFGAGHLDCNEIYFLIRGAVSHEDTTHGALTAFAFSKHDRPENLTAEEESELLYMKLPTF